MALLHTISPKTKKTRQAAEVAAAYSAAVKPKNHRVVKHNELKLKNEL